MRLDWPEAFLATLALETPAYLLTAPRSLPRRRAVALALVANLATHPLLWRLASGRPWPVVGAAELAAWALESIVFWRLGRVPAPHAALMSLVANALSAGVGLLLS